MSTDRLPTFRRAASRVDPLGVALVPVVVVALGALYDAIGDGLSFFGEPGAPDATERTVLAGGVLLAAAGAYARRRRPILGALVGLTGAVPPLLVVALPDTGYGLLAIWTLGPLALAAAIAGCVRVGSLGGARAVRTRPTATSAPRQRR